MRSILASGGPIKDALADSSFSQSFRASADKYGTIRSQVASPRQAWGAATQLPVSPQQPASSRYDPKGRTMQNAGQPPSAFRYFSGAEKHNDSLFESSKETANY